LWVELGAEDEGSGFTLRAASDVGTGELQHQLTGRALAEWGFLQAAQQLARFFEQMFVAAGAQAGVTDTHEACGEDVKEEAADELAYGDRDRDQGTAVVAVTAGKRDGMVVDGEDAMVGEGGAVGVAGEVVEEFFWGGEGRLMVLRSVPAWSR